MITRKDGNNAMSFIWPSLRPVYSTQCLRPLLRLFDSVLTGMLAYRMGRKKVFCYSYTGSNSRNWLYSSCYHCKNEVTFQYTMANVQHWNIVSTGHIQTTPNFLNSSHNRFNLNKIALWNLCIKSVWTQYDSLDTQ